MPRQKARSRGRKKGGGKGGRQRDDRWDQDDGKELVFENASFRQFYKDLGILSEEEADAMVEQMKKQLATNFRLSALHPDLDALTHRMETDFKEFEVPVEALDFRSPFHQQLKEFQDRCDQEDEAAKKEGRARKAMAELATECGLSGKTSTIPLNRMKWYTPAPAYQFESSRRSLRRTPELRELHKILVDETEAGNITRQEAVSMLPPLLLDVQPHHRVLDMCASPGSKTSQLLEALHECEKEGKIPTGVVVANDNNPKRAYMLVHQCKRMTAQSLVVSVQDGQQIPAPGQVTARHFKACQSSLERHAAFLAKQGEADGAPSSSSTAASSASSSSSSSSSAAATAGALTVPTVEGAADYGDSAETFDRVLADVPCSGDGTFRKNVDLWLKWTPSSSISLHNVQVQIAARGLQLLRTGGRMVYSTCSMSPYEDEAVLGALLRWGKGSVRLVNVEERLPGFKRRPGVSSWTVMDRHCNVFSSFDDIPKCMKEVDKERTAFREKLRTRAFELMKERGVDPDGVHDGVRLEDDDPRAIAMRDAKIELLAASGEKPPRFPLINSNEQTTKARPWSIEGCQGAPSRIVGKYLSHISSIPDSLFPPTAEEAAEMHLERSFRVVPQDNDTGGFFVALLERTGPLPDDLPVLQNNRQHLHQHTGTPKSEEDKDAAVSAGAKRAREEAGAAGAASKSSGPASGAGASSSAPAGAGAAASPDGEPADKKPRVDGSSADAAGSSSAAETSDGAAPMQDDEGDSDEAAAEKGGEAAKGKPKKAKSEDERRGKKGGKKQPRVFTDEDIAALPRRPRFGSVIPLAWFKSDEARHSLIQTIPQEIYDSLHRSWGFDRELLPREQLVVRNGNLGSISWVTPESARLVVQPMETSVALTLERSERLGHDLKHMRMQVLGAIRRQTNIVICGVQVFETKSTIIEPIADMSSQEDANPESVRKLLDGVDYRVVSSGAHLIEPAMRASSGSGEGPRCLRLSADDYAEVVGRGTGCEFGPDDKGLSEHGRDAVKKAARGFGIIALDPSIPNADGKPTLQDGPGHESANRTALLLQVRTSIPCQVREGQMVRVMVPGAVVEHQGINLSILARLRGKGSAAQAGAGDVASGGAGN